MWERRAAGCIAKLVTQYLGYTNFVTALEGLLIGAKAGIDLSILAQIVPVSAGASRTFENIPRAVFSGEFTSGGTLDIVAKDLHLACELAREVGAPAHIGLLADDVPEARPGPGLGAAGLSHRGARIWRRWRAWSSARLRPGMTWDIKRKTPDGDKRGR